MYLKMEGSSHRPLLEGKYGDLVMKFISCIGPTAMDQTCYLRLIHVYERLPMICNPVIMRKYCQIGVMYRCVTTSQYFRSSATRSRRKLDKLMLFYHVVSYTMPCLGVKQCIVVSMHLRLFTDRCIWGINDWQQNRLSRGSECVFWLLFHFRNVTTVFIYVATTHYTSGFSHFWSLHPTCLWSSCCQNA